MKKIFISLILFLMTINLVNATLYFEGTQWIRYDGDGNEVHLGPILQAAQGEDATFVAWITSSQSSNVAYRIFFENGDNIVPAIMANCSDDAPNSCDFTIEETINTGDLAPDTYTIIIAANEDGSLTDFTDYTTLTLTVTEAASNHYPDMPTNPYPIYGAQNVQLATYLSWTASDIDGDDLTYDVYLDTSENPTTKIAEDLTVEIVYPENLEYDTTYYWKVIAFDGEFSTSSYVWTFTTEEESGNHAPNIPSSPNPSNEETGVSLNPTLSWIGGDIDETDLVYYQIRFNTELDFPDSTIIADNIKETEFNITENLEYDTTYYWKVIALDNSGALTVGPAWSFTTRSESGSENHAPLIQSIDNQRARCSREFRLQVVASDQDNDQLRYFDNSNLFNINQNTGLISFTPSCNDRGTYSIVITVMDEHGAIDTENFDLQIYTASSSGGSGSGRDRDNDEDENDIEITVKTGVCIDDKNGDNIGVRTLVYKTVDSFSGEVLSLESKKQSCLLFEEDDKEPKTYEGKVDSGLIIAIALLLLLITVPLAILLYKKLSKDL